MDVRRIAAVGLACVSLGACSGDGPGPAADAAVDAPALDSSASDANVRSCTGAASTMSLAGTTPLGAVDFAYAFAGKHTPKGGIELFNLIFIAEPQLRGGPFGEPLLPPQHISLTTPLALGAHVAVDLQLTMGPAVGTTADVDWTVAEQPSADLSTPMVVGTVTATDDGFDLTGTIEASYCSLLDTFGI